MIGEKHHIPSAKLLFITGGSLFLLTILTTAVHFLHLPQPWSLIAALLIAIAKASLVVFIFMNIWWDKKFNFMTMITGIAFVALLIAISLFDLLFRNYTANPWG